jgi:hypothetical protein
MRSGEKCRVGCRDVSLGQMILSSNLVGLSTELIDPIAHVMPETRKSLACDV